jgi:AAA domain
MAPKHPAFPRSAPGSPQSAPADPPVSDSFTEYLISLGYKPEVALGVTPAQFFGAKDRAWAGIVREVRRERPTVDPRQVALQPGVLAGLLPVRPSTDLLDELDREFAADEERFPFFTSAQLNSGQFETRYLIPGILTAGQPGGIFGAFKTLKTSIAADLLISLASGTPFLNHFPVAQPGKALFLSGESGLAALQSIARRVCAARALDLDTLVNFELSPRLPRLDSSADVRALRRVINNKRPVCVVIDPAYLSIRGDDARNLFAMGSLLRPLAEIGDATGCTILVVHHCKRSKPGASDPATLDDIAWSGFAEFAAQWLLLSRRRRFDPDLGRHELWFSAGGRAGHHGLWALDAHEGVARGVERRKWKTAIRPVSIAEAQSDERRFQASEDRRVRRMAATFERHRCKVLDFFGRNPQGVNARYVRDKLGINGVYVVRVLESLVHDGLLAASEVKKLKRTDILYSPASAALSCQPSPTTDASAEPA